MGHKLKNYYWYYFSPFFLLTTMLFFACRKIDRLQTTPNIDRVSKFFTMPGNTDKTVQRVANELKRQNNLTGFINDFAVKQGYAVWDKAILMKNSVSKKNVQERNSFVNETGDTLILIPLVLENTNYVNSFIAAKVSDEILLKLYAGNRYDEVPFDKVNTTDTITAEKYAMQLMLLDNYLFGRKIFRLTDDRLFESVSPIQAGTTERILEIHQRTEGGQSNRMVTEIVTVCLNNYHCTLVDGYCTPRSCDMCSQCYSQTCLDFDVETWYDDDWGGGGSSGGGGSGGSGGSGGTGDPCINSRITIIDGKLACSGGDGGDLGWEPVEDIEPDTPCDPSIADFQNDVNLSNKFMELNSNTVTNLNYEKGYMVNDRVGNNYTFKQGQPATSGSTGIGFIEWNIPAGTTIDGLLHSHYSGGNSIFSPQDILFMAQIFLQGYARDSANLFFGMTSSYGSPYLIKISNIAAFRAFALKNAGSVEKMESFDRTYNNPRSKGFATNDPTLNEKRFLEMMKKEIGEGIKLYRSDSPACNQWTKLSIDNFGSVNEKNCF